MNEAARLAEIRAAIIDTVGRREALRQEMADWYRDGRSARFPLYAELAVLEIELTRLQRQLMGQKPSE